MKRLQALASVLVFGTAAALLVIGACKPVSTLAPGTAVLSMFANPTTVAPGGSSTLTISVFEASGQPVPDDTLVTITSTLGSVEPEQVKTQGGFAQATFRAGTRTGSATLTARSGSAPAVTITLTVGGDAMTLSVRASPASLPVGGGSATLTATVHDASGLPVAGVPVVFTTSAGSFESGGAPRVTDATGQASDTLRTTLDATVTATVQGATISGMTLVDVAGTGAASLAVVADPTSVSAGGQSTLTATAKDAQGLPVVGFAVVFTTSAGRLAVQGPISTNGLGQATNVLTTDRSATVTAAGAGVMGTASVSVGGSGTPAARSLSLAVSPEQITKNLVTPTPVLVPACNEPDGFDVTLTAKLTAGGQPVAGESVVFFTDAPASSRARVPGRFCVSSGAAPMAVTNSQGLATIAYTISKSERLSCDEIRVPCAGAVCSGTACGTPTPTPSVPPTFTNNCCCGIRFHARVGTLQAQAPSLAFRIYADRDCGTKLCSCIF